MRGLGVGFFSIEEKKKSALHLTGGEKLTTTMDSGEHRGRTEKL